MTTINEQLGLPRAPKRSMMQLPSDRALRVRVTSARCPACQRTGAHCSRGRPGWLVCSWCQQTWPLDDV
jgi:hypothetical protein